MRTIPLNRTFAACAVIMAAVQVSCIRDELEPCPPLQVTIDIEDKNYDNIDYVEKHTGLEHRLDENMAFSSYISTLSYTLYDMSTGEAVASQPLREVGGEGPVVSTVFPEDLPFGRYRITVWGNIASDDAVMADGDFNTYDLHMGGAEGYDVYLGSAVLTYDEWNFDHKIQMKRLKGKLVIEAVGFPEDISRSYKTVSGVMGNVDSGMNYSESEDVTTERVWDRPSDYVSRTYLAPSASGSESSIEALLYDSPSAGTACISLPEVSAQIRRNQITVLRYTYDEETGTSGIFILLENGWNEILNLEN